MREEKQEHQVNTNFPHCSGGTSSRNNSEAGVNLTCSASLAASLRTASSDLVSYGAVAVPSDHVTHTSEVSKNGFHRSGGTSTRNNSESGVNLTCSASLAASVQTASSDLVSYGAVAVNQGTLGEKPGTAEHLGLHEKPQEKSSVSGKAGQPRPLVGQRRRSTEQAQGKNLEGKKRNTNRGIRNPEK